MPPLGSRFAAFLLLFASTPWVYLAKRIVAKRIVDANRADSPRATGSIADRIKMFENVADDNKQRERVLRGEFTKGEFKALVSSKGGALAKAFGVDNSDIIDEPTVENSSGESLEAPDDQLDEVAVDGLLAESNTDTILVTVKIKNEVAEEDAGEAEELTNEEAEDNNEAGGTTAEEGNTRGPAEDVEQEEKPAVETEDTVAEEDAGEAGEPTNEEAEDNNEAGKTTAEEGNNRGPAEDVEQEKKPAVEIEDTVAEEDGEEAGKPTINEAEQKDVTGKATTVQAFLRGDLVEDVKKTKKHQLKDFFENSPDKDIEKFQKVLGRCCCDLPSKKSWCHTQIKRSERCGFFNDVSKCGDLKLGRHTTNWASKSMHHFEKTVAGKCMVREDEFAGLMKKYLGP